MLIWILLVVLIVALVAGLPHWPYATAYGWGYFPSGIIGVILIIVLIALLLGYRW